MKKIIIYIFFILFISSCNLGTNDLEHEKVNNFLLNKENIPTKQVFNFKNKNSNNFLIEKEQEKLYKIINSNSGLFLYKLNCKDIFKTKYIQQKCELEGLKEAGYDCLNKDYFGTSNINIIFNKDKFNLINTDIIKKYKNICKNKIENIKQLEIKKEDILQKIKNFKISDCETKINLGKIPKYILEGVSEEEKKKMIEDKKKIIKQCKIGFIINYKNGNCNLLKEYGLYKECKDINSNIKKYKKMQMDNEIYGGFDLIKLFSSKK